MCSYQVRECSCFCFFVASSSATISGHETYHQSCNGSGRNGDDQSLQRKKNLRRFDHLQMKGYFLPSLKETKLTPDFDKLVLTTNQISHFIF
jgi:hypothetical protein